MSEELFIYKLLGKKPPNKKEQQNVSSGSKSENENGRRLSDYRNLYTGRKEVGYSEPEISPETKRKFEQIKQITNEIEKVISENKGNFHVETEPTNIDYAKTLNEAQHSAVTYIEGPLLVIAGAGTGKTRTLTYRTAYLLEKGVAPNRILLVTFTRKSAAEMVKRIKELLKNQLATSVNAGTFHAIANGMLRKYSNMLGIPHSFTILAEGDSEDVVSLIKDELQIQRKSSMIPKSSVIHKIISAARNRGISIEKVIMENHSFISDYVDDIENIAQRMSVYKRNNFLFNFDDLIEFTVESLRNNSQFREAIQSRFDYVMVDEYQDTNPVQKEFIELLVEKHNNIMVVGDDSQAIYAFRGADYQNILTFPKSYPNCKVVKIEENYRSSQATLDFTNNIITNASVGYKKKLFSQYHLASKPLYKIAFSPEDEASYIVQQIKEALQNGTDITQIAVLYRATFHANFLQTELLANDIPFVVVGGLKFTDRRHVRDVVAFLKIVSNPYEIISWNRILKLFEGIGVVTAQKIIKTVIADGGVLNTETWKGKQFFEDLKGLKNLLARCNSNTMVTKQLKDITDFYNPILKVIESDHEQRVHDLSFLYTLASNHKTVEQFLSNFALDPPSNSLSNKTPDDNRQDVLTLSTIHSAKGLEWERVFVIHLVEGIFPSRRSVSQIELLEEERRLFYVACTRAKKQLYVTQPKIIFGWDGVYSLPSRFLREINPNCYLKI